MKKISPNVVILDRRIYFCILKSFLDFVAKRCAFGLPKKVYEFEFQDNPKGVGQLKSLSKKEFKCPIDCFNKKVSEKFCIELNYIERSKKLVITVISDTDSSLFLKSFNKKNKNFLSGLLASYFNNLAQGLLEAYLPRVCVNFQTNGCYFYPQIKYAKLNRLKIFKKPCITAYADDILTILYSIYSQRKVQISLVKIKIDEILELRGVKKHGFTYQKEDIKRVLRALDFLSFCGFLYFSKISKHEILFSIPLNVLAEGFFIDETLLFLNPKTKKFEKILGVYLSSLAHKGKFCVSTKKLIELVFRHTKLKKPSLIRERIEYAFDNLQDVQMLENWEYKQINEDDFYDKNWFEKYKKLTIIFCFKKQISPKRKQYLCKMRHLC